MYEQYYHFAPDDIYLNIQNKKSQYYYGSGLYKFNYLDVPCDQLAKRNVNYPYFTKFQRKHMKNLIEVSKNVANYVLE